MGGVENPTKGENKNTKVKRTKENRNSKGKKKIENQIKRREKDRTPSLNVTIKLWKGKDYICKLQDLKNIRVEIHVGYL